MPCKTSGKVKPHDSAVYINGLPNLDTARAIRKIISAEEYPRTMRLETTAKRLAEWMLKYYRI